MRKNNPTRSELMFVPDDETLEKPYPVGTEGAWRLVVWDESSESFKQILDVVQSEDRDWLLGYVRQHKYPKLARGAGFEYLVR